MGGSTRSYDTSTIKKELSDPTDSISSISKFTEQVEKNAKHKKLSDKTLTMQDGIDVITDHLSIPAGILLAGATGNPQNFANGMLLMKGSGSGFKSLYRAASKKLEGKYKSSDGADYSDIYKEIAHVANTDTAYNKSASFTLGRKSTGDVLQSASVQLEDGYAVDVAMYAGENRNKLYHEKKNGPESRIFNVEERRAFREMNPHISGNKETREAYLKKQKIDPASDDFELTNGEDYRQLVQHLDTGTDDDLYLDITGAPYVYKEDDDKLYPSTVRYSGDSLKELMEIAKTSAKMSNLGTEHKHTIDMVDLTYAHGKHSHEVREKKPKLTRPEYQLENVHPELISEENHKRNLSEWVTNKANGLRRGLNQLKEKGTAFYKRLVPSFKVADTQLDEVFAAVASQTDGVSPVKRPVEPQVTTSSPYHTGVYPIETESPMEWKSSVTEKIPVTEPLVASATPERVRPAPTAKEVEMRRAVALNEQHTVLSLHQALSKKVAASSKGSENSAPE